jgi:antitoxin component YwqK of YwqJK toxin-antitoxin module
MKLYSRFKVCCIYFIPFVMLVFSACNKKVDHNYSYYFKDGLILNSTTQQLYTGVINTKVNNKKLVYDVLNGKKNGTFVTYFANGRVEMIGEMNKNKNSGYWKYYYSNGTLESEGNFNNDVAVGNWKWYYPDGSLKEQGAYQNGKKNGVWLKFESNGKPLQKNIYVNDKKVSELEYYKFQSV